LRYNHPAFVMRPLLLALTLVLAAGAPAQDRGVPFTAFHQFTDSLAVIAAIPDAAARTAALDALWTDLIAAQQIPFRVADSAAFLHRTNSSPVQVAGDHSNWSPQPMTLLEGTNLWLRVEAFPADSRLDYKLIRAGNWILDPHNPHQQMSGFGPNSELRMPEWVFPEETVRQPGVPEGTYGPNQSLASAGLGYSVTYRVWTPAGYDGQTPLPVVYITDGHEYAADAMGAVRVVMDNLIHAARMEPAIAVFIDPRVGGQNRRQEQYVQNPAFAAFVAEELVPVIDAAYATRASREGRVILGTSLGGLFSAYLGILHTDTFARLAIQSPAFWVSENANWWTGPSIFDMMEDAPAGAFEVYMHAGTFHDGLTNARRMRDILLEGGHTLTFAERNQGHSWGHWKGEMAVLLETLLPPVPTATEPPPLAGALHMEVYPNPASGAATVRFRLEAPADVSLDVFDVLGRRVGAAFAGHLPAGEHALPLDFGGRAPGPVVVRLRTGEHTVWRRVTVGG
jgi:enterochelin esterase-like enzyme